MTEQTNCHINIFKKLNIQKKNKFHFSMHVLFISNNKIQNVFYYNFSN